MKKLIATIVSIGVLSLSLVACSGGKPTQEDLGEIPAQDPTSALPKDRGQAGGGGGAVPNLEVDGVGGG